MNDFEKSSDSIKYGSGDPNLLEQEKEKKKKKKRCRNDLMFNSPGRLQAQIDPKRISKPPNFLLPEYTSKKTYPCASVITLYKGRTYVEIQATFDPGEVSDRSRIEEGDHFSNSEIPFEDGNEFELNTKECPTCRQEMDYDVEFLFTGKCAVCFTENTQCSLVCSSGCDSHGLCDMCFKRYKQ